MDYAAESLKRHYQWRGKLETVPKMEVKDRESLSLAYTPGVAQPCLEIQKDPAKSFALTGRWNTVAVVTDGSAVLGLGDIGPEAGVPVMEGKCVLFKAFGGVDAVPLCLGTQSVEEIVRTVELLSGSFGGINLEDISAPRCFAIEEELKKRCPIPVFHDDQHGTAIVVAAALINALKLVGKTIGEVTAVFSGAGAAGTAIFRLLKSMGLKKAILCDKGGVISSARTDLDEHLRSLLAQSNPEDRSGTLGDVIDGADVFIGVSAAGVLTGEMVGRMAPDPIVFAMANPAPEIMPEAAKAAGCAVVGTGRSDYPNQINNVLAFPGVFRGALDVRAREVNEAMKLAAARAIAGLVGEEELSPDYILPAPFDGRVCPAVAEAVAEAARETGVAQS